MTPTIQQLTMKKTSGDIAFSSISDVHLWHPRVPTARILGTLNRFYPDADITGELDYILIAGDLFDRLRTLADNEVYEAWDFFTYWLAMLKRRGVRLRILEGTPSHDRRQTNLVTRVNNALGENGCDLRYVDTLKIDYEEEFDFNILYLPDEWRATCDDTWDEVTELLHSKGLDKVDICIMHGMFEHQVPPGVHIDTHKLSRYESITNWFITIGHVHSSSIKGKAYAQGSPDRLSHNEEEAKGIFKYLVHDRGRDNKFTAKFITNDSATPFITLDLVSLEMEPAMQVIKQCIEDIDYGNVRLLVDQKKFSDGILDQAQTLAGNRVINWSKKVESKKIKDSEKKKISTIKELPKINPNTIGDLCASFAADAGYAPGAIRNAIDVLEEFK
ncbi:SbcD-like subunit of palindrome specific endonuclease [Vibrio phage vB_VpaM_sm033]|nr:SbcD-like subunit of palindrome specific endonuclease [Vibrio phage vB_VpaM_sm033]